MSVMLKKHLSLVDRVDPLADLKKLDITVFLEKQQVENRNMVRDDIERHRLLAIRRENKDWAKVNDKKSWQQFRDVRIRALRKSLGTFPKLNKKINLHVSSQLETRQQLHQLTAELVHDCVEH